MEAKRFLAGVAVFAILLTAVCTLATVSVTTAVAEGDDGCTWKCHEATWDGERLTCSNNPKNCTACELVCPEILQPRQ